MTIADDCECPVCLDVAKEAQTTDCCCQIYCLACIRSLGACPICRTTPVAFTNNKFAQRIVRDHVRSSTSTAVEETTVAQPSTAALKCVCGADITNADDACLIDDRPVCLYCVMASLRSDSTEPLPASQVLKCTCLICNHDFAVGDEVPQNDDFICPTCALDLLEEARDTPTQLKNSNRRHSHWHSYVKVLGSIGRKALDTVGSYVASGSSSRRVRRISIPVVTSTDKSQKNPGGGWKQHRVSVNPLRPRWDSHYSYWETLDVTNWLKFINVSQQVQEKFEAFGCTGRSLDNEFLYEHIEEEINDDEKDRLLAFLFAVRQVPRAGLVQTKDCSICMNSFPDATLVDKVVKLDPCGHLFCGTCLKNHIRTEVETNSFPVCCPECKPAIRNSDNNENATMNLAVIQEILHNDRPLKELFDKKSIAFALSKQANVVYCPGVDCENAFVVEDESEVWMVCNRAQCRMQWCRACKATDVRHTAYDTCDEFAEMIEENRVERIRGASEAVAERGMTQLMQQNPLYAKCPGCQANHVKDDGCNHMTCPLCKVDYCLLCNRIIHSPFGSHYDQAGPCEGKWFTDPSPPPPPRLTYAAAPIYITGDSDDDDENSWDTDESFG
ncbi:hypothetical protein HK100_008778 [Physocladia obscura]|uniref:RING-type domain-containing protein n=1 Tax=Physocladia obscura TaxID=109957 RepID=A0AAD5XBD0_9FUNG|nr:hypothetical protein HK100_008778 [Physocladia obscura]